MSVTSAGPRGRGATLALLLLSLVVLAILLVLGTWQVQRLHWKEDLLATIDQRLAATPGGLDDIRTRLVTTGDVEYWPVAVTGRFRHEGERHFFATHQGRTGYYVYTPLETVEGSLVLVNRGFVPYEQKDAATRAEGQVEGEISVTGLARGMLEAKPSFLVPDNEPDRNQFFWKDLDAMAASSGVGEPGDYERFFIDAGSEPNPGGLPIGGVTIIDLPNNHLQYAITWYGVALALAGVLAAWLWRMRRGRP